MMTRGVLGALMVLVGGLAPEALVSDTAGRMCALVVVLVGLALLGSAWIELCRDATVGRVDVAGVRRAVFSWVVPLMVAPPLFSNDGWSYAAQGAMTRMGLSPYIWTPSILTGPLNEAVDPMWRTTPAPYGPVPLLWGGAAAMVTQDPLMLVLLHRLLALAGLAMLAWAVPRLARWSGVDPARASALALGSPLVIGSGIGGLHNDMAMVGLMAVALVVGVERHWALGAAIGGLAAAVKVPGGLVCIGIVLATVPPAASLPHRVRRAAEVGVVAIGALVLAGVPRHLGLGWVHALGVPGEVHTPLSMTTMLGGLVHEVSLIRTLGLLAAVAIVAWVSWTWPTGVAGGALRGTVLVVLAFLVLLPTVHLWYLLWVTPLAATLRLTRVQAVALMAVGIVAGLAAPLDSSLHGLYLVVLGGSALATVLAGLLLLSRSHRGRVVKVAAAV